MRTGFIDLEFPLSSCRIKDFLAFSATGRKNPFTEFSGFSLQAPTILNGSIPHPRGPSAPAVPSWYFCSLEAQAPRAVPSLRWVGRPVTGGSTALGAPGSGPGSSQLSMGARCGLLSTLHVGHWTKGQGQLPVQLHLTPNLLCCRLTATRGPAGSVRSVRGPCLPSCLNVPCVLCWHWIYHFSFCGCPTVPPSNSVAPVLILAFVRCGSIPKVTSQCFLPTVWIAVNIPLDVSPYEWSVPPPPCPRRLLWGRYFLSCREFSCPSETRVPPGPPSPPSLPGLLLSHAVSTQGLAWKRRRFMIWDCILSLLKVICFYVAA